MLKSRLRITSCFLWVCLSLLGFYSPNPAKAEVQYGVNVTVYNNYGYNNAPPLPPQRPIVGTLVQSQIDNNFDQQPLFNMYEDFIVKYEGFISAPCTCPIQFMAQGDDGTKLYINDALITNDWRDKGGGGSISQPVLFTEGESQPILLWFYENGGGAWVQLYWNYNGMWEIIPASAFTLQQVVATTTLPETTTTTEEPTTTSTLPPTTVVVSTTTSSPDTSVPVLLQESSTTVATTTSSSTSSTTTTTVARTTTTSMTPTTLVVVPSTTSSVPPTTLPESTTSSTSTTTIAPNEAIAQGVTAAEATAIATNPEVLKELTSDQADKVFEAVEVSQLTDAQADELVAAVQNAPDEVRASFEDKINVFSGKFNKYVPLGSKINIAQRKVLIAATGVLFMSPTVSVSSSTSGSTSSDSKSRRKK